MKFYVRYNTVKALCDKLNVVAEKDDALHVWHDEKRRKVCWFVETGLKSLVRQSILTEVDEDSDDWDFCDLCGEFNVPFERVYTALFSSRFDEEVEFATERDSLIVSSLHSKMRILAVNNAKTPLDIPTHWSATFVPGVLAEAITVCSRCVGKDNSHYALGGCLIDSNDDELFMISTDGKCVTKYGFDGVKIEGEFVRPNIPEYSARKIASLCKTTVGDCVVSSNMSAMTLATGEFVYTTVLLEGRLPNLLDIIRQAMLKADHCVVVNITEFLERVQTMKKVSMDDYTPINIEFDDGKWNLFYEKEGVKWDSSICVTGSTNGGFVKFDARKLEPLNFFASSSEDTVTVYCGVEKPCVFVKGNKVLVVMPIF